MLKRSHRGPYAAIQNAILALAFFTATEIMVAAPAKVNVDTKTRAVTVDDGINTLDYKGCTLTLGSVTISDAAGIRTISLGSTNGTKIGATGDKMGFLGATPIVRPSSTTDLRQALINLGLYTTGGASPLNLNGGAFTGGTISGTNETLSGTLGVTGNTTLGTLAASGAFTGSSITLSGNETVGGTFSATGNSTFGGTLGITGALTGTTGAFSGTLAVTGTTTLGAATSTALSGTVNPAVGLANLNYIDARWYGVDMTGVADSTAALNNAIAAATASQTELSLSSGTIKISSTIAITSTVKIRGTGGTVTGPVGTTIVWAGASGGTMMTITEAPSCELSDISLDGNMLAANGLSIIGSSLGYYRGLHVWHYTTGFGVKLNGNAIVGPLAKTCSWNTFINLVIEGEGSDGNSCLWITGNTSNGANACLNTFINTRLNAYDTNKPGIRLGPCDTNTFYSVWIGQNTATPGVLVVPELHADAWRPNSNVFHQLITGSGGWVQPAEASLLIACNTVYGYNLSDNPLPVLNGTNTLVWIEDDGSHHNLGAVDMLGDLNVTTREPNAPPGIIVRPIQATSNYAYLSLRAVDWDSSFTQVFFGQHDSDSPGTTAGLANASLSVLQAINASNLLVSTNNSAPVHIAAAGVVQLTVDATGVIVPSLTASSFLKTDASKRLVSKTAAQMRTDLGIDTVWASVYNSTDVATAGDGTLLAIPFDTDREDVTGMHSTSSNTTRVICTTAGVHTMSGSVSFDINGTGIRYIGVRLTAAGGSPVIVRDGQKCPAVTGNYTALSFSTTYYLAVGDYAELIVSQTSTGTLNVKAFSGSSPEFTMLRNQ